MPPRRNIARRGRKSATQGRCAGMPVVSASGAAQQLESSKLTAAVVVVEKLSDSAVAKKPQAPPRKAAAASCAAIEPSPKKKKLADAPAVSEPEPAEVEDGAEASEEEAEIEEEDGTCEALFLDVDDDEGGSPAPSDEQKGDDENHKSAAEEEPAEAEKGAEVDAEENAEGVADEVYDEAAPEDDEECADEGAENMNGEEYAEVDEAIVEEEAGDGEEETGEAQEDVEEAGESQDGEEEVVEEDEENVGPGGEYGAEGDGTENWEAAADGAAEEAAEEAEYYEEGTPQDGEWDEEVECVDADDAEVVDDADDAEGAVEGVQEVDAECAEDGEGDHVMDDPAVHDETARDTHDYGAAEQLEGTGEIGAESSCVVNDTELTMEAVSDATDDTLPSVDGAGNVTCDPALSTVTEEGTVEITQLSELCPTVVFEQPETITESFRDSIQRSVQLFIERLLRDAKELGPEHESMAGQVDKVSYGCSLCNIQIEQPEQFDCHMEGAQHMKRLRWLYFMGLSMPSGPGPVMRSSSVRFSSRRKWTATLTTTHRPRHSDRGQTWRRP
ncbi:hypothetical protein HPB50_011684 [Hyalomma asiaticum]|uniref:Uncharacterized protein n=1 Tax=Hyalomma asiaticum TaxID=266040 RepID=A0ACB7S043_HYAAI|nr:hypothetical protein HPB50_011684 [Hyalomma asiaticum]